MQGFLELRSDGEANCHPGESLESENSDASSWRVGRISRPGVMLDGFPGFGLGSDMRTGL